MSDKPILEHIERIRPPWRTIRLTECGHDVGEFTSVLSPEEALAKVKREGIQRASYSTCITCMDKLRYPIVRSAANGLGCWHDDPVAVIAREATNYRRKDILAAELHALTVLWERHQDEYLEIVSGLDEAADLQKHRKKRQAQ